MGRGEGGGGREPKEDIRNGGDKLEIETIPKRGGCGSKCSRRSQFYNVR